MRLTSTRNCARTFSRSVQSMVTLARTVFDQLPRDGAQRVVAQHLHRAVVGLQRVVEGQLVLGQLQRSPRAWASRISFASRSAPRSPAPPRWRGSGSGGWSAPASRRRTAPARRSCAAGLDLALEQLLAAAPPPGCAAASRAPRRGTRRRGSRCPASGQPGRGEDVDHALGRTAREMICRMACSSSSSGLASPGARLASTARTAWKNATSSRMRSASRAAPPARRPATARARAQQRSLPSPAPGCAPAPPAAGPAAPAACPSSTNGRPVEAVEEAAADLVLLQHQRTASS
jgi:hypothetical protein